MKQMRSGYWPADVVEHGVHARRYATVRRLGAAFPFILAVELSYNSEYSEEAPVFPGFLVEMKALTRGDRKLIRPLLQNVVQHTANRSAPTLFNAADVAAREKSYARRLEHQGRASARPWASAKLLAKWRGQLTMFLDK